MLFHQLHHRDQLLLLATVWDAGSAQVVEQSDFEALGTSSAAIANVLGYDDGEQLPFSKMYIMVEHIKNATQLPLSVDIEAGYSRDTAQILDHIAQLVSLGVVGINIEDSVVSDQRRLVPVDTFADLLTAIKQRFGNQLFVNARTDTYLLGIDDTLDHTLTRLKAYENAGADGAFIPCLTDNQAIKQVCEASGLPINLMVMPALADLSTLSALGVKRVSMGNMVYQALQRDFANHLNVIQTQQHYDSLFSCQ